jgi:hypothetical protein
MCRFVTAILPREADAAELVAVFRTHGRACHAYVDAALAAQIDSAQITCRTTTGHCDCDTPLGEAHSAARRARDPENAAARFRRKGWSEAKIERALAQRNEADSRPRTVARGEQPQTSLREWCILIREALALPGVATVGLLIHDCNSGTSDETIVSRGREAVPAVDLSETLLAAMHSNTIYEFHR